MSVLLIRAGNSIFIQNKLKLSNFTSCVCVHIMTIMMDNDMVSENNLWGLNYFVNDPLYLLIIPYIALQPICRIWAKDSGFYEKNKDLCKRVMAGYNLIMTLFSFICASVMIHCLMNLKKGVFSVGHYEDENVGKTYDGVAYYFYLSKYVEFLDTFFLILCNRPVIWLQYLHHIGAPLDMGLGLPLESRRSLDICRI